MAGGKSRESIGMAMETLRANKLRSGLTILGVVIGVATVITLSSFINGLNRNIGNLVASFGTDVYWKYDFVFPSSPFAPPRKCWRGNS